MSTLEVNSIQPLSSGTTVTLGASGKTFTIPSGCTITNSGTATGFGGGKLGQVATSTFTMDVDVTSTSLVELNSSCRVSLTPSASSSKFIFQVQFPFRAPSSNNGFFINFYRDIGGGGYSDISGELSRYDGYGGAGTGGEYRTFSAQFLNAPSTASAVTFTPYVKVSSSSMNFGNNGKYSAILMEILA